MTPFDFLRPAHVLGFGLRAITAAFALDEGRNDDLRRAGRTDARRNEPYLERPAPALWYLHGR